MELKEQAPVVTLARRLASPAHVSGLAIRLARSSGAGDRLPEWLLKVAVERGAAHYQRAFDPSLPPDNPMISDEEIGIALCLGQHPYSLDHLRAAAQLLSSPRVDAAKLCAASPCASDVNRCSSTLRRLRNGSPPRWNLGRSSGNTCPPGASRDSMRCPIGAVW